MNGPTANSNNMSWAQRNLKNDLGLEKHNSNLLVQL